MSGCPFLNPELGGGYVAPSDTNGNVTSSPADKASILGFVTTEREFIGGEKPDPTHYGSYLGIEELMKLQDGIASPKPGGKGLMHHEELTFIVVHQVFELWFKLMIADLRKAHKMLCEVMSADSDTYHKHLNATLGYLRRSETIFQHATGAFTVMETMHPADFLEFRDYLVPASGFQSVAFRVLEQLLGVPNSTRALVNNAPVFSYLTKEEQQQLSEEAKTPSLNDVIIRILSHVRVPDTFEQIYYDVNQKVLEEQQYGIAKAPLDDPKAAAFIKSGIQTFRSMMENPVDWSEGMAPLSEEGAQQYQKAVLGALFVMSYRHEGPYSSLAALLDELVAVEECMLLWRGRHVHMAERMIGRRSGTGGTSSGVGYLDVTRHYRIFHILWLVRKMFIRASALPPLDSFNLPKSSIFDISD